MSCQYVLSGDAYFLVILLVNSMQIMHVLMYDYYYSMFLFRGWFSQPTV